MEEFSPAIILMNYVIHQRSRLLEFAVVPDIAIKTKAFIMLAVTRVR